MYAHAVIGSRAARKLLVEVGSRAPSHMPEPFNIYVPQLATSTILLIRSKLG